MPRLYFVRHGDAYDDEGLQFDDSPLNNYGKVQALQLAKRLKYNKFDAMYCSKLKRSIETCEIVNEVHKKKVKYLSALNEVGGDLWPQPGAISKPENLTDFNKELVKIYSTFKKIYGAREDKGETKQEVIVFTHGNWIRVLLTKILSNGDPKTFCHFVIHHTSLTIIDVGEDMYEYIITVSDAAHTQLFRSRI